MGYGVVNSTGTRFNWYASTLDDLKRFSVALPATQGCSILQKTTVTANEYKCAVATNAGYFQFSPKPTYCLGEIVINGSIVQFAGDGSPMFSVTAQETTVIGPLTKAQIADYNITFGVSGFGVLVENGAVHTEGIAEMEKKIKMLNPTAEEIAPRTVIALDADGRLLIVAIDGVEGLLLGLTLPELAEIMSVGASGFPFKASHAINMDGGGSTTMSATPDGLSPAQIYNRPTDTDLGPITERAVTSIACISL